VLLLLFAQLNPPPDPFLPEETLDFPSAQKPSLTPLRYSFAVDDIEDQLRNLFVDLFDSHLSTDAFDANVLGAAHLGTLALVKRSVNKDGLVLLPGDREEAATRYVYRAWKSGNVQGRGLYFLKTYLQALFPGVWSVEQQMQDKAQPYPTAMYDRSQYGDDADKYMTSRVHIKLDATGGIPDVTSLVPIISAIIPARFVPKLIVVSYSDARYAIAAQGNAAITLRSGGTVLEPSVSFNDAPATVAAQGNVSITLRSSGAVTL
jgi:hypothetical protein